MISEPTKKNKGVHTRPDRAGIQNFKGNENHLHKADDPDILRNILKMKSLGTEFNKEHNERSKEYKGFWTEQELADSIAKYFDTVAELNLKPNNVGLAIWLGISKDQYYAWRRGTGDTTHPYKSYLLKEAEAMFEEYLLADIDKHTVGDIFLLKCKHDYIEKSQMDITTNGNPLENADEVRKLVANLGLQSKT